MQPRPWPPTSLVGVAQSEAEHLDLLVAAKVFGDLLPTRFDIRERLVDRGFAGEIAGEFGVKHHARILLRAGDGAVRSHVRIVQGTFYRTKIVLGEFRRETCLYPRLRIGELRVTVGIEAGPADSHIDVRLSRLVHVGQEVVSGLLDLGIGLGIDGARPATEGRERRIVDAIDYVRRILLGHRYNLA